MAWRCFMAKTTEDSRIVGAVWEQDPKDFPLRPIDSTLDNGNILLVSIPSLSPYPIRWSPHFTVGFGGQWQIISGEPPNITVMPSIGYPGVYHGWLRDGILTDDLDGREYPLWAATA